MPQVVAVAASFISTIGANVGFAIGGTFGASILGAEIALSLATSLLLSAASNALMSKPSSGRQEQSRDLAQPSTAPDVRYVYGDVRATGTPAGTPVKGDFIYGCWVLNSRWSDLTGFKLFLDKREVEYSGDPYDFSGVGATATNTPFLDHINFWISRGDETGPPDTFTSENGYNATTNKEGWKTTDGWQGITTIWMKLKAGADRQTRWPSAPPYVEAEALWSRVFDPREVTHVFDDETTWTYSNNWSLCCLDALKSSPIRPYQELNLDLDSFATAADVSDRDRVLKAGGTEKEYILAGTLVFSNGELEDQVLPMVNSAVGNLIRSGGSLGLLAAEYQTPSQTYEDFLGNSLNAIDLTPTSDIINEVRTTYISPDRDYDTAELAPYKIPNALAEDGGLLAVSNLNLSFCPSATQAMRVRKIYAGLVRRQKSLTVALPPIALDLVPGSTVTLDLPVPFDTFNGVYEVQSTHPGMELYGSDGMCSMIVPVQLVKHSAAIYDWTPAIDEEDVILGEDIQYGVNITPPGAISASVLYVNNGSAFVPTIKFLFDPSPSTAVNDYEYQYSTDGTFIFGSFIAPDTRDAVATTKVFVNLSAIETENYTLRIRAKTDFGNSNWVTSGVVNVDLSLTGVAGFGEVGQVRFTGTTPISPNFASIRVYSNSIDDFDTAVQLGAAVTGYGSGQAFEIIKAESAGTKFYYLVPFTTTNLAGTVSGPFELTVT